MFIARNSGTVDGICPAVLYPGERFINDLQGAGWKLLHDLAAVTDNYENETASRLEEYFDKIRKMNEECHWHFEAVRENPRPASLGLSSFSKRPPKQLTINSGRSHRWLGTPLNHLLNAPNMIRKASVHRGGMRKV
jgi:hypothetical protein